MLCSIHIFNFALNFFLSIREIFCKKNQEKIGRIPAQWSIGTNLPGMFSLAAWQFRDDGEARAPARLVHFLAMGGIGQRRHRAAIRGHIRVHMPVLVQFYGELHSQLTHAPACGTQMTQEKNSTVRKYTRRTSRVKADTAQRNLPLCVTVWSQVCKQEATPTCCWHVETPLDPPEHWSFFARQIRHLPVRLNFSIDILLGINGLAPS